MENGEGFAESITIPAELLMGRFTGIEALEEEYGSGDIVRQGIELLQTAFTKSYNLLHKLYGGKVVGIILYSRESSANGAPMLNVNLPAGEPRLLAEASPIDVKIAEVILVRRSLAWITGIIFLVSTLMGIYYLLYMPLTRDTLLYSNVKLD
ncbi:uncharacterized protein A4U43_C10F19240 [Asparagus officinalis]|uniref:DUF7794 domain-containing protein n=2 Tax=Asparagus officinalis TaxID=4686 RepID=A0A5P1E7C3_ASPOF|nr:uncharacterized protein A4U43_C10F19240 [Asparagus officinalis]